MNDLESRLESAFAAEAMRAAFEGVDEFARWGSDGIVVESISIDFIGRRIFVFAGFGEGRGWMRVSFSPGMSAASVTSGLQKAAAMEPCGDGDSSVTTTFGMSVARGSASTTNGRQEPTT